MTDEQVAAVVAEAMRKDANTRASLEFIAGRMFPDTEVSGAEVVAMQNAIERRRAADFVAWHALPFDEKLLALLAREPFQPRTARWLAHRLGAKAAQASAALQALKRAGKVRSPMRAWWEVAR